MHTTVGQLSEKTMSAFASAIYGAECRVVLSDRLEASASVAFDARLIAMHSNCSVYDLLCLTCLLREYRGRVRTEYSEKRLPKSMIRSWLKKTQAVVENRWPGLTAAWQGGHFHPDSKSQKNQRTSTVPQLSWKQLTLKPLSGSDILFGGEFTDLGASGGIEIVGDSDDLAFLLGALEAGRFPMSSRPELPGIPVVTIPLKLAVQMLDKDPDFLRWNSGGSLTKLGSDAAKCMSKKFSGLIEYRSERLHRRTGKRLDSMRLHQAFVASKTGTEARVFRDPMVSPSAVFTGTDHVWTIAFDGNSDAVDSSPGSMKPRTNSTAMEIMSGAARTLRVRTQIWAFYDRFVTLSSGQSVYLHIPMQIKDFDEPFDNNFWQKLFVATRRAFELPGTRCLSIPAAFQTSIMRTVDHVTSKRTHAGIFGFFPVGMEHVLDDNYENFVPASRRELQQQRNRLAMAADIDWMTDFFTTMSSWPTGLSPNNRMQWS